MFARGDDRRSLDATFRTLNPVAAALVDSLASGRIERRAFLRRGAMIGLSAPMLGLLAQACSSDDSPQPQPSASNGPRESSPTNIERERTLHLIVGVPRGDPNSGLDPLNMAETGTYAIVSQSFEHLVGTDADGAVAANGLATSWSPNVDGSEWTFVLREGARWANGRSLTVSDVRATLDRLAAVRNAALDGVIGPGSASITDERTVVVSLTAPNGNFPVLLSAANPQSLITPSDYVNGTTLDKRTDGTGPWILESFDAPAFIATLRRNPDWWGPAVALETVEIRGFGSADELVAALQRREIDVVSQVAALVGSSLVDDPTLSVVAAPSAAHRQIWFNTKRGLFEDRRLRQAVALAVDRSGAVAGIGGGRGALGNDHPIRGDLGSMPFFDPGAIGQRARDLDRASGLVADVGAQAATAILHTNEVADALALAEIVARDVGDAGLNVNVETEPGETFYRDIWCPVSEPGQGCVGSAEFGIIEYEHQALPDIAIGRGFVTNGSWNASNYSNPDLDRLFAQYQRSVDIEDQRRSIGQIQAILWTDVPVVIAHFDDILTAHDSGVTGIRVLPSGQPVLSEASWA